MESIDKIDLEVLNCFKTAYPDDYQDRYIEWEQISRHPVLAKHAPSLIPREYLPRPDLGELPQGPVHEFTLTVPSGESHPEMIKTLADGFYKVISSKMWDVAYYEACVELTKAGIPHIHAIVVCDAKPMKAANAKKLYPHRLSVTRAKDVTALRDYVWKGWGDFLIKNYCDNHYIRQFFRSGKSIYAIPQDL